MDKSWVVILKEAGISTSSSTIKSNYCKGRHRCLYFTAGRKYLSSGCLDRRVNIY